MEEVMPPEDDNAELLEMHDSKMSIGSIAAELGMSTGTVTRILKENGRDTSRKPKEVDEAGITQAYLDDEPVPAILTKFKLTYDRLYQVLKDNSVPTRKIANKSANKARLDRAVELYVAGAPLLDIKSETGISQPTLHAELYKRNVPLRRPRML
jgi:hypothetical protein